MNAAVRLKGIARGLKENADAALVRASQTALTDAREASPVRTGALRGSLALRREGNSVILSARVPYAYAAEMKTPYLRPAAKAACLLKAAEQACKEAIR